MRIVRRALTLLLGLSLASGAATAQADVLRHRDAVGDVARAPVGSASYSPAPKQVAGDILATRVVHGRRAVRVQIRLRELTTTGNGNFHLVSVKTPRRTRNVELDAFPDHWEGRTTFTGGQGRPRPCAVTHRIDYDRNLVRIRIPHSCLGRAAWVRVGIRSSVAGALYVYADDARRSKPGSTFAYGRKIPL
jgi:hypothetical protein